MLTVSLWSTLLTRLPRWLNGRESAFQCRRHRRLIQSLGREGPLEKEMATHFSILAWENPMDIGAWWATVPGVTRVRHH